MFAFLSLLLRPSSFLGLIFWFCEFSLPCYSVSLLISAYPHRARKVVRLVPIRMFGKRTDQLRTEVKWNKMEPPEERHGKWMKRVDASVTAKTQPCR